MATLVLQSAGAAIGASFGPIGALLGRAAGAIAGNYLDQRLFGGDTMIRGPRLEEARILSSSDGAPMPRLYGRARLGGQLVWATRFEEHRSRSRSGGKGSSGVTVEEYSYFGNFAVAICEGPVSGFGRIWADGNELDQTKYEIRFQLGDETQLPDPLIEGKQGAGNAPALRGTAYAVFEGFPLEAFGNRIPQLSFEVIRSVARLDKEVRAITLIPGSTEFGLDPEPVYARVPGKGKTTVNRNNLVARTDWEASIDALQALCPNLERVALVVAWFGDDLRAGACSIAPRVEYSGSGADWRVSDLERDEAQEVSRVDGRPAYGGTPSDRTVIAAIRDLRQRGLEVALYPFIMMDVPADNALPDPNGAMQQPAYPWRGDITCDPAPGLAGTADGTASARTQIDEFVGDASPGQFSLSGETVHFSGSQWRFRRMVLHYAKLAVAAGGVDAFLIGSEMRGLTPVRDGTGAHPFVEALCSLAADARAMLGPASKITYAADWSEYFGHHPQDGSGDLLYHLDPLWAHPAIDAVGIDNYMPLADWRVGGDPGAPEAVSQFDPDYLAANIAGGEGFDWYYASPADRLSGSRTPITDGEGEPWVWRSKDIVSWWSNEHHERRGGVRSAEATAWIPRSKPIWFTELGCGAVAMGANQPNVFPDPKSGQTGLPYFSTGARCDAAQNRFLMAHYDHWSSSAANPLSPVYGGPMVDLGNVYLWAWDARPFPQFPANDERWSDGANWRTGHWLNGRLGGCPIDDLVVALAGDFGFDIGVRCDGFVDGYVVSGPMPTRQALEPLCAVFGLSGVDEQGVLTLQGSAQASAVYIDPDDICEPEDAPRLAFHREEESDLPHEAELTHAEIFADYESQRSYSRRLEAATQRKIAMQLPAVMPRATAVGALDARLRQAWIGRETLSFRLPWRHAGLCVGDLVQFTSEIDGTWRIETIEDGESRRVTARACARFDELPAAQGAELARAAAVATFGQPEFVLMNLPIAGASLGRSIYSAITADPWAGRYSIWSSPSDSGFTLRTVSGKRAVTGRLTQALSAGPEGRWDEANRIRLRLNHGELAGETAEQVLNGANAAAIRAANGEWEIVQFANAERLVSGEWELSRLLRGQMGTDPAMRAGCTPDADLVILDTELEEIELGELDAGLTLNWRAGPASDPVSDENHAAITHQHRALDLRPLSPVHLRARRQDGDIALSWIRRARIAADDWEAADIALDEVSERYLVSILDPLGAVLRVFETTAPSAVYLAEDEIADFGAPVTQIALAVAQIASSGLAGAERRATLTLH